MSKRIIAQEPWSYTLYGMPDGEVLSVLCGTSAMFEIHVRLTAEEMAQIAGDPAATKRLAEVIRANPGGYVDRRVPDPAG